MKIIIDTCFWIALYNPEKHIQINDDINFISDFIEDQEIIIPFPSLYEFLNSKFSRRNDALHFQKLLSKPNYIKVDDSSYKDGALDSFFEKAINEFNDVSLVDEIIKEIISAKSFKIDYLISFDDGLNNYARSIGVKTYS
ncbi:hypothetical protein [Dyadobacter bucti]|uniref:hypothetical protein n=1 Tax=Dyadobacter bucti TaxID=2572203 RepID=UPI0011096E07|nr:hypothetical protein [Dyadobacter bucti]